MNKIYTGIGARKTPKYVLDYMYSVGKRMAEIGWILRSGAADGADAAFEAGCDAGGGEKEIYLPWKRFNNHSSSFHTISDEASKIAYEALGDNHWNRLSSGAQKLHSRNVYQVLGWDLKTPSKFILYWAPVKDGIIQGGTATAIKVAHLINTDIRCFNLFVPAVNKMFERFMRETLSNANGDSDV